ncbi:hypothetical protein NEDG_00261 [Nematocida displodere]|uniref:Poly A polymerase head domain-containing protein n=1 Tax=Nematocida displodere TaxID=1805483 RepID=A0A177EJA1_9MICR|nr:hypothetical protein NEDG_00261 [Nematocida displodere]
MKKMSMITPTREEDALFRQLLSFNQEMGTGIVFRVAGGWVRDKIMGLPCNDIDIAIDKTSGSLFAHSFIEHLKRQAEEVSGFHIIPYNHEKAKHLETASLRYHNYEIDFVCLRSEKYADTRIPVVEIGTPQEDADRRDLTINALFYNLNTQEVEDYTGKGLSDIKKRLIRTPLAPKLTFHDDPLRILRVLRFAARLSFTIDQAILDSLGDYALVSRMAAIVSRERIGQELRKTLASRDYPVALSVMVRYRITDVVFEEIEIDRVQTEAYWREHSAFLGGESLFVPLFEVSLHHTTIAAFSVLQHALRCTKQKKESVIERTIVEGLKWTKEKKKEIERVAQGVVFIDKVFPVLSYTDIGHEKKLSLLIKVVREVKEHFPVALVVYYLIQRSQGPASTTNLKSLPIPAIYQDIHHFGFEKCFEVRPPVDFQTIAQETGAPPTVAKMYLEEATQLSILHQTRDKDFLIRKLHLDQG